MSYFHFDTTQEHKETSDNWILKQTGRTDFLSNPLLWIFLFCFILWIFVRYFPAIDLVHDNLSTLSSTRKTYGLYLFFGMLADLFLCLISLVWWQKQSDSAGRFQKVFWMILLFAGTLLPYINKPAFAFINDLHVWLIVFSLIFLVINWTRIRFHQKNSVFIRSGYRLFLFSIALALSAFSWSRHISALCQIAFLGCYLPGSCILFGYFSFQQVVLAENENSSEPFIDDQYK